MNPRAKFFYVLFSLIFAGILATIFFLSKSKSKPIIFPVTPRAALNSNDELPAQFDPSGKLLLEPGPEAQPSPQVMRQSSKSKARLKKKSRKE